VSDVMSKKSAVTNDSDDLESLFDSIVTANKNGNEEKSFAATTKTVAADDEDGGVFNEIGHMTRALHDSLRELGYDKNLQKAASDIPDARDRLNYIASMTQAAAERVLNATEAAQPIVDRIESGAKNLAGFWGLDVALYDLTSKSIVPVCSCATSLSPFFTL